jgi:hypothetical protein
MKKSGHDLLYLTLTFALLWVILTIQTIVAWDPFGGNRAYFFHKIVVVEWKLHLGIFVYSILFFWLSLWIVQVPTRFLFMRIPWRLWNTNHDNGINYRALFINGLPWTIIYMGICFLPPLDDESRTSLPVLLGIVLTGCLVVSAVIFFHVRVRLSTGFYFQLLSLIPIYILISSSIAPLIAQVDPSFADYRHRKALVEEEYARILKRVDAVMKSHGLTQRWDADWDNASASKIVDPFKGLEGTKIVFAGELKSLTGDAANEDRRRLVLNYQQHLTASRITFPVTLECELTSDHEPDPEIKTEKEEVLNLLVVAGINHSVSRYDARKESTLVRLFGTCHDIIRLEGVYLAGKSWRPWGHGSLLKNHSAYRPEIAGIEDLPMTWPFF